MADPRAEVFLQDHLDSLEELADYLRKFVPPDLRRMENIMEAFALSSLAKVLGTTKAYILLSRQGLTEESVILARTIVEVAINCFWVQKNETEHQRRIAALVVMEEEAKVKRTDLFLKFAHTNQIPDDVDLERKKKIPAEKRAFIETIEKDFARLWGYNKDYKRKVAQTRFEEKVEEIDISRHYLDVFTSACDTVHAGTAGLGMYTRKTPWGWAGYDQAFPYDVYNIDAIYTILIELALHVAEVYPLFKGSEFNETIERYKQKREDLLSWGIEVDGDS